MNRSGGRISRTPTRPLAPSRGAASLAVSRRTHCHSYRHGRAGAFPGRGGNFPGAWDWAFPGRASGPFQTGGRLAALPPAIPATPPRPVRGVLPSGDR